MPSPRPAWPHYTAGANAGEVAGRSSIRNDALPGARDLMVRIYAAVARADQPAHQGSKGPSFLCIVQSRQ